MTNLTFGDGNTEYVATPARGQQRLANAIYRAADDGGTIPAADMLRLFPGRPELHSTCSLARAMRAAGIPVAEID